MAKLSLEPAATRTEFKRALTALASDAQFRAQATKDPKIITRKFKLSLRELNSLREVAVMSGADIKAVDKLRVAEIKANIGRAKATNIDISCCSCCCCCCGETAVAPMMYSVL
jgi:hypothetical protein